MNSSNKLTAERVSYLCERAAEDQNQPLARALTKRVGKICETIWQRPTMPPDLYKYEIAQHRQELIPLLERYDQHLRAREHGND